MTEPKFQNTKFGPNEQSNSGAAGEGVSKEEKDTLIAVIEAIVSDETADDTTLQAEIEKAVETIDSVYRR